MWQVGLITNRIMKKSLFFTSLFTLLLGNSTAFADENDTPKKWDEVVFNIVETSDVHANFFPYNFIERRPWGGSLARVHSFLKEQRAEYGDKLFYVDNGDLLQGQPTVYYYNYIDTKSPHIAAEMLNFMGCSLATLGNHDVETGHAVYDRWISQCNFPVLGANIIDTTTGLPYLKPYHIFERDSVKVAVLGMITESVPYWLPETLWSNLRFESMESCAKRMVKILKEKEKVDVIVGLFHSGRDGQKLGETTENASQLVAERVPGFDAILFGHDHGSFCKVITNVEDEDVLLINPSNNAMKVASITITVRRQKDKQGSKEVEAKLVDLGKYPVSEEFVNRFSAQFQTVNDFVNRKIGTIDRTIYSRAAIFGNSAFVDLLHDLQLKLTGADISFCAPLSTSAKISEGDIHVSDMFNLYKFENMLYTMSLTGQEIKDYLEMSYDLWTNQMETPNDHILLLEPDPRKGSNGQMRFKNMTFNFDSAAGINYTVDVTKPKGQKITISSMANGKAFSLTKTYKCAINSYRGNGGGDLLTKGAGIPQSELKSRIVGATEKDLRFYLMNYIEKEGKIKPRAMSNWKFIPERWTKTALQRDRELMFD